MKEVWENIKKKSKAEKALIIIMAIGVVVLMLSSLAPLLYVQQ